MDTGPVVEGIFVGIDSGGTRTNVEILAVKNSGDHFSASYEEGVCLSGALAPERIPETLNRIVARLR